MAELSEELNKIYEGLNKEIKEILALNPDAQIFSLLYSYYIHKIDDLIDEPKDPKLVLEVAYIASILFTNPFFVRNSQYLLGVDHQINDIYANTIEWENEDKRRELANTHRHAGLMMLHAVIMLVGGREQLRKISKLKWEECFDRHNGDF
jgi:hypothetical protein